jgi:hypothetical protein
MGEGDMALNLHKMHYELQEIVIAKGGGALYVLFIFLFIFIKPSCSEKKKKISY